MQAEGMGVSPLIRTLWHIFRTLPPILAVLAAYCVLLAGLDGRQRRRSALFVG
jgi:hypothetical protein